MIKKKSLLLIAGTLWFVGGSILIFRGVSEIIQSGSISVLKLLMTVIGALIFYRFVFRRISSKHIARINDLPADKYPFYMFLSVKSYIMMLLMIGIGVSLRLTGLVPLSFLMYFLPVMGSSLLISAIRFYRNALL